MKYMLDTNICIYIIKNNPISVKDKFKTIDVGDICISVLTFFELEYGAKKSTYYEKNMTSLLEFVFPLEILDLDSDSSIYYAQNRVELEKSGTIISEMDLLIASNCMSKGLILVTNNVKEFERIENLKIENWVQ